jgi:hypothetical protein
MHGRNESDVYITERNSHVELLLIFFNNEVLKIGEQHVCSRTELNKKAT